MSIRFTPPVLAALFAVSLALAPSESQAGTVGYYFGCRPSGSPAAAIAAAGHTAVEISTVDEASLAPLDALVMTTCGAQAIPGISAINASVSKGMGLVLENLEGYHQPSVYLPGSPSFTPSFDCPMDINVVPGTPVASGDGGVLTNSSFDFEGGLCALTAKIPLAQLPAGAIPFLTSTDPNAVGAFGYTLGNGRIAYSSSQFFNQLPGNQSGYVMPWAAGARTYIINALNWTTSGPKQSCASEGYTGTKLTWCQNICEKGYTGGTLSSWIKRWTDKYRDLPYCAIEK